MYSKSRPTPLRQRTSARKRPAGRESRGSQVAGRRGNVQQQMLEVLEDRRLLSGNPIISGPASVGEGGTYYLNVNDNDENSDPVSWFIDWGDGEFTEVSADSATVPHVYDDGLSYLNIMASADGCPADSEIGAQFGSLKYAITHSAVTGSGTDLVIQPDGKILVASSANGLSISRFNDDGTPDTAFGNSGRASVPFGVGGPATIALQADGKVLVGGRRSVAG
ncbi:MAG TPA: delta-60 repeat domain-containing protein, partial [Tepidisphaeraceae bacterium]|nr:delta-60 repeat domain-containing protein [Tepidisphaeraceae bacterium]